MASAVMVDLYGNSAKPNQRLSAEKRNIVMKQISLATTRYERVIRRKRVFPVETMLRIHFLQQWFGLSHPAMGVALQDVSLYCEFARLDPVATRMPDESTILGFRHLLEQNNLGIQLMATINVTLA